MKTLSKSFFALIIICIAVLIAIILVKNRAQVPHSDAQMNKRVVKVIRAKKIPFQPTVFAYGNVEPATNLLSMAQLSGKISFTHPDLKQGGSIKAGTVVVRIESKDYTTSLKQTQADLEADQASLKQLEVEEKSTSSSLALAQQNLKVGEQELRRIEKLWQQRLVARSAIDAEQQKVLQLQQQVQDFQGKLETFSSRKQSMQARIKRAEQQVKGQETTLGRTEITLPFDARIGQVYAQQNEFVNVGSKLFEAQAVDSVEINAQLPVSHLRGLLLGSRPGNIKSLQANNLNSVLQSLGLKAKVRLVGGLASAVWDAKVTRISESIDPNRRTVGIVVTIPDPYEQAIPGQRPPLIKGMYTEVALAGTTHPALVIPHNALHQGRVYIADDKQQLQIRKVEISLAHNDLVIIKSGINEGEQVIVTDLYPIIEQMPLQVNIDEQLEVELRQRAVGEN